MGQELQGRGIGERGRRLLGRGGCEVGVQEGRGRWRAGDGGEEVGVLGRSKSALGGGGLVLRRAWVAVGVPSAGEVGSSMCALSETGEPRIARADERTRVRVRAGTACRHIRSATHSRTAAVG